MHKIIVANYKMNGDKKFYQTVQNKFNELKLRDTKVILCPPFVYLPSLKINNKNVEISSQDISNLDDGKSTGQISGKMLKEFNVKYCLIGHFEKRILGENLHIIKEKISNAINNKIQPIICVDFSKDIKNLEEEIKFLLTNQKKFTPIFAYEPSYAIDSNRVAKVDEINLVVDKIKSITKKLGLNCKVLYGGGVGLKTYAKLKTANVDGFLLGGVSLDTKETITLIKEVENE